MYLLGIEAKRLVVKTFDEMQHFGRFKYTNSHTSFTFLIFVVYKTKAKEKRKECEVVNICKLNDLVISNTYPFPL